MRMLEMAERNEKWKASSDELGELRLARLFDRADAQTRA
jgi:hypothetical protein